jgi:hypothetical protein
LLGRRTSHGMSSLGTQASESDMFPKPTEAVQPGWSI